MTMSDVPDAEHYVVLSGTHYADGEAYEPGDELPEEVATGLWPTNSDQLAALDSDGNRMDTAEEVDSPIQKWREQHG